MNAEVHSNGPQSPDVLLQKFDWKRTSLGGMSSWSPYLKGAISVCMRSRFPNMILAGNDLLAIYNEGYSKILENKHPEAFGSPISKVWPDLWEEISPLLKNVLLKGESILYENRRFILNRKDFSEECFFTFSYSPVLNDDNVAEGILVSVIDTTQTVRNDSLLRELRNRQLKSLFVQAPLAMCILRGPKLIVEVANDRMLEIWGKSSKQMMDRPLFEALLDARDQGFEDLLRGVYTTGDRVVLNEIPVDLLRNGKREQVFVKLVYEALREDDESISGIMVVADEITDQIYNRKKIAENEERLRLAIEITKLGTWDYNPVTGALSWSDECRKIYDYPEDRPVDFALFSTLLFPADKTFVETEIDRALRPGGPGQYNIDFRILRYSDRQVKWITATGKVFFDKSKQPERFIGTVIDITERKNLQEKLAESELRVRLAVEASQMGTFDWDIQKSTFHFSESLAKIFGYNETKDLNQNSFGTRIHAADQKVRLAAHDSAFKNGTLLYEARIVLPDSSHRWVRVDGKVVYDHNQQPARMYGTTLDITEHKAYAEQLEKNVAERTAKLELQNRELEQFAYIASHDLQEPLRKIRTYADIIRKKVNDNGVVKEYFDKIDNSAVRMSELIKSVLNYSKLSDGHLEMMPVDLNRIISGVVIDFELLIEEKKAEIIFAGLPTVNGNSLQLSQLFSNLISNSLKFTEKNPVIRIDSVVVSKDQIFNAPIHMADKNYMEITISDNGIGFDQKYAQLIFTIFQRLHGMQLYAGTGIGLALCRKIVEMHGGHIAAKSDRGKGSTFFVYLPVS